MIRLNHHLVAFVNLCLQGENNGAAVEAEGYII